MNLHHCHYLQSTVISPGALLHWQERGHPIVSGHERDSTGKSLRRTLDEGEMKREDAEERGVSMKSDSGKSRCWQLIEVGTT